MIIYFGINSGLGNEIFQYSFLKAIQKNKNDRVIFFGMNEITKCFDINEKNLHFIYLSKNQKKIIFRFLYPFLIFLCKIKIFNSYEQIYLNYYPTDKYLKKNGILPITIVKSDFFQNENFFKRVDLNLNFKQEYLKNAKKIISNIPKKFDRVFIHIRRGDYLTEKYNNIQGVNLPKKYFIDAINKIESHLNNPFYVILSDDKIFVETMFNEFQNKLVSYNIPQIDLAIMTLCNYGICSNSSFSWWGAYLIKNRKKIIFPSYWFGWKSRIESHPGIQPSWSDVIDF